MFARPIRFVLLILIAWIGARAWMQWPSAAHPRSFEVMVKHLPLRTTRSPAPTMTIPRARKAHFAAPPTIGFDADGLMTSGDQSGIVTMHGMAVDQDDAALPSSGATPLLATLFMAGAAGGGDATVPAEARADLPRAKRFSGYAWLFGRGGGGQASLASEGQLGGGQAGARIDYALATGVAATGRVSIPTQYPKGKEAALGISWQPTQSIPARITVERRVALDGGGRNAFAAFVAGGVGPVEMPAGFRLDAYAQAGAVGAKRLDGFADGSASVTRPLVARGNSRIAIGAAVWGAVQPGVSRVDVGPRARIGTTIGGAQVGASLDWRQRVAGNAAPRSGVAFTLDGSF